MVVACSCDSSARHLDLVCDNGESFACLAGARGLDGRVERQHVGLVSDVVDDIDDLVDLLNALRIVLTSSATLSAACGRSPSLQDVVSVPRPRSASSFASREAAETSSDDEAICSTDAERFDTSFAMSVRLSYRSVACSRIRRFPRHRPDLRRRTLNLARACRYSRTPFDVLRDIVLNNRVELSSSPAVHRPSSSVSQPSAARRGEYETSCPIISSRYLDDVATVVSAVVQRAVLLVGVIEEVHGGEGFTRRLLDEVVGPVASAVLVDVFGEPVVDRAELAGSDVVVEAVDVLPSVVVQLRGQHRPERVGGEVPEGPVGPVDVLQAALGVGVGRIPRYSSILSFQTSGTSSTSRSPRMRSRSISKRTMMCRW